jgi:hypothetical protein
MPVVSDFDCFMVGTRGVKYEEAIPSDQFSVLMWCVNQIETILDGDKKSSSWTSQWLDVLKTSASKGFHPEMPPLGYSDPKSHNIMKHAVRRLKKEGAVRHGAECFNYYFPQELDDEFLVISDNLSGHALPWKYVGKQGLQEILKNKIDLGYTFPIHPKWIMCDMGWKEVYDKLMASNRANVQDSLKVWYPPESGIREKIEVIHQRHPGGFRRRLGRAQSHRFEAAEMDGTAAMDLAELELKYYLTLQRAKRKLRGYLLWSRILRDKRKERAERFAKDEEEAEQKAENAIEENTDENAEGKTPQKAEHVMQAQPDEYAEKDAQEKTENVSQAQADEIAEEEAQKSEIEY